jgi:two-component system response regulator FlrC
MRMLGVHSPPGGRIPALHPQAAQRLLTYAWPGNVRELENVMQRALVLCDGDLIRDTHIVFEPMGGAGAEGTEAPIAAADNSCGRIDAGAHSGAAARTDPGAAAGTDGALAESLAQIEQKLILQALRAHDCRDGAAAQLGISPRTLRYKMARLRAAGVQLGELGTLDGCAAQGSNT